MAAKPRLSLKGQALKYLSMREHSRVELRRKMSPHARLACAPRDLDADSNSPVSAGNAKAHSRTAFRPDEGSEEVGPCLDKLLDWLEQNGLLSSERFVESRVRTRAPRFGTSRIRRELSQHGVDLPPDTRKSLEATEVDRAREVWARKFDGPATDAAARAKQMRFLSARGFSPDAIRRVVWNRSARDGSSEAADEDSNFQRLEVESEADDAAD